MSHVYLVCVCKCVGENSWMIVILGTHLHDKTHMVRMHFFHEETKFFYKLTYFNVNKIIG